MPDPAVKTKTVPKSKFVRQQIIMKKDVTLEEIQKAWALVNGGKADPLTKQDIHDARSELKRRYYLDDADQLPRNKEGRVNVSELMRKVLAKNPDWNVDKVIAHMDADGIEFSRSLFRQVQSKLFPETDTNHTHTTSPKTMQTTDAAKVEKTVSLADEVTVAFSPDEAKGTAFTLDESVEVEIDALILKAEKAASPELVRTLRKARRLVGVEILKSDNN